MNKPKIVKRISCKFYIYIILIPTTFFVSTKIFPNNIESKINNQFVDLRINDQKLKAEVADTIQSRTTGLMYRKSIKPDEGMLFIYKQNKYQCMWMKNTSIPLSVAFIDKNFKIINIRQMKPYDETPHCSSSASKYALEMRSGWFKKNKITLGQKIFGIQK